MATFVDVDVVSIFERNTWESPWRGLMAWVIGNPTNIMQISLAYREEIFSYYIQVPQGIAAYYIYYHRRLNISCV